MLVYHYTYSITGIIFTRNIIVPIYMFLCFFGYTVTSNHILYVFIRCFSYFVKYISFHFFVSFFIYYSIYKTIPLCIIYPNPLAPFPDIDLYLTLGLPSNIQVPLRPLPHPIRTHVPLSCTGTSRFSLLYRSFFFGCLV